MGIDIRTIIGVCSGILFLLAISLLYIRRKRYYEADPFENMEGTEFEESCAEILRQNGYRDVELTKGSHDYGIDIFAYRDGIKYAIQCKCYSDPVGIKAVQEAYSGKDFYDCMVAVVMTNQYFTKPAEEFARKLNVLLWDGEYIRNYLGAN